MGLFIKEEFTSHSGLKLNFKIECDYLLDTDWATLAYIVSQQIGFGSVEGIPNGGIKFAEQLKKYAIFGHPNKLVADDVATTGKSFKDYKVSNPHNNLIGVVAFDRSAGKLPYWVYPVFTLNM